MSSTTLCSTSASSLSSSDRSSSTTTSTDRIRPTSHRKPTATRAMATNTTKIPPGKGVRTAATVKSKSQALGSSKDREAVAKRSLTRAGGRAVAASLKTAGNPVNRSPTPTRKASSTATGGGSRREKPPTHLKLATTSTTSSSSSNPSTPQGRVRGIRTASAAKVQPLKIPAALKSNISFTELKKQNQILLKDIDQLKSDRKDDASKHDEEMSALKSQLHKTEDTVNKLQQEVELKTAYGASQEQLVKQIESKLDQVHTDKERLLLVLEGSRRDVLTGEEIAAIQEQGASQQQQQQELQLQLDNYEQLLDNMITGLEQTNIELKTQHSAIEESFTYFQQQQLMAES